VRVGISLTPGANAPARIRRADELGFDSAILVDSPMLFGDPYVSIAAGLTQTRRITLMPGVTNPVIRPAQITAATLASLNAIAPGRVAMGIGTGYTATGAMGLRSAPLAMLERYVQEVRGLLRGEVVDVAVDGRSIPMQFLNTDPPFMDLSTSFPVYMAAAGPRMLELAGRIADGVILGGTTQPDVIGLCRNRIGQGARAAGRTLGDINLAISPPVYLTSENGASLEELRRNVGPKSLGPAENFSRLVHESTGLPPAVRDAILAVHGAYKPDELPDGIDPRRRHLHTYRGYRSKLQDWQQPLVTADLLDATCLIGSVRQCCEKLEMLAGLGVDEVILNPTAGQVDDVIDRFGEAIPRLTALHV
jgi:5,10-methylenetetrahydromethanopterin reductase